MEVLSFTSGEDNKPFFGGFFGGGGLISFEFIGGCFRGGGGIGAPLGRVEAVFVVAVDEDANVVNGGMISDNTTSSRFRKPMMKSIIWYRIKGKGS